MYWMTGISGAILMAAPFLLSYSDNTTALWTSLIAGFVVLAASLWEGLEAQKESWEYWLAGAVGIIAILAPFTLGFGSHTTAMWTTVVMGAIITGLAGYKVWMGGPNHV